LIFISKGTGLIANQLAELYQPIESGLKKCRKESLTEKILTEKDLRRLNHKNTNDCPLVFVCQPGKDELDEMILQTISVGSSVFPQKSSFSPFLILSNENYRSISRS
jgi:hypothetical protein